MNAGEWIVIHLWLLSGAGAWLFLYFMKPDIRLLLRWEWWVFLPLMTAMGPLAWFNVAHEMGRGR